MDAAASFTLLAYLPLLALIRGGVLSPAKIIFSTTEFLCCCYTWVSPSLVFCAHRSLEQAGLLNHYRHRDPARDRRSIRFLGSGSTASVRLHPLLPEGHSR